MNWPCRKEEAAPAGSGTCHAWPGVPLCHLPAPPDCGPDKGTPTTVEHESKTKIRAGIVSAGRENSSCISRIEDMTSSLAKDGDHGLATSGQASVGTGRSRAPAKLSLAHWQRLKCPSLILKNFCGEGSPNPKSVPVVKAFKREEKHFRTQLGTTQT